MALLPVGRAHAATIFVGDGSISAGGTGVSYEGVLDYQPSDADSGVLVITLTNTTDPASIGGYLTGFVFNVNGPFGAGTAVLASTTDGDFEDVTLTESPGNKHNPPIITYSRDDASPYGSFEAGAALNGALLGGGNPNRGIAVGASATFVFNLTGSGVGALTDLDFLTENGVHPPGSVDGAFVARFRGLENGGSDKVVPGTIVPLPASVWGGLGLLAALGGMKLRARRSA